MEYYSAIQMNEIIIKKSVRKEKKKPQFLKTSEFYIEINANFILR